MAADMTTATFARGTLTIGGTALQVADIKVNYSIEHKMVRKPQLSTFPIGALVEAEDLSIEANLIDVTSANLVEAFGTATESAGTITLGAGSPIYDTVSLVVACNANGSLSTVTIAMAYGLRSGGGTVDLENPPHGFPIKYDAVKKDAATAAATITVA